MKYYLPFFRLMAKLYQVNNDITGSSTWDTRSDIGNISEMALLWLQIKNATKEYEVQWYSERNYCATN